MRHQLGSWGLFFALYMILLAHVATASAGQGDGVATCAPWSAAGAAVGPARYDAIERDYLKRDVVFPGGAAGVQLAGELTIPSGAAPRAGLILVTGSGPQDRDETVAGRKPFFVLSDALTRAGYAVLRYDDRGVGGSTGSYDAAMIPDFADDAAAAADMLRSALDDDGLPIGIVGHSEGGLVALQAARRTAVDFLVLLASPVAPFSDVIYDKTRSSMLAEGETPDRAEQRANALRRAIRLIGESADPEAARSDARSTLISGGLDGEMAMAYAKAFTTPHWYWVAKHIPMNDVLDFPGPIFALYAADDAGINSELMTGVIEAEALPSVEHRVLDCLNHFFQRANISGSSEYSDAGPVFDGETIPVLVEWLDRQAD